MQTLIDIMENLSQSYVQKIIECTDVAELRKMQKAATPQQNAVIQARIENLLFLCSNP